MRHSKAVRLGNRTYRVAKVFIYFGSISLVAFSWRRICNASYFFLGLGSLLLFVDILKLLCQNIVII